MLAAQFILGAAAGINASAAQAKQQSEICSNTKKAYANYNEYYNTVMTVLTEEKLAARDMQNKIDRLGAEVGAAADTFIAIQKQNKMEQSILNIVLTISTVITAIMLYLKYKGVATANPLSSIASATPTPK